jgi:hypothetical protein
LLLIAKKIILCVIFLQALRFVKETINLHKFNENVIMSVIKCALERLCDVIMFCDEKSPVYAVSRELLNSVLDNNCTNSSEEAKYVLLLGYYYSCY